MRPTSLAFKLALSVSILGLLQAAAVLAFSYFTMSNAMDSQKRQLLQDKISQVVSVLNKEPNIESIGGAAYRLADLLTGYEDLYIAVSEPQATSPLVSFSPIALESLRRLRNDTWGADAYLNWRWRVPETSRKMLSLAAAGRVLNDEEYVVVMTADRTSDQELLTRLLITSLTAAPFVLAIVWLAAMAVVTLGLRPLNRLRNAATAISARNLTGRIDPRGLPSELQPLCDAFNSMLDRLHDSVSRLSQFSGDLAHEMRTPIAILLGRTQVALSQPRTQEQLLELLGENVEELERLSRLISDMLFLAQAENATTSVQRLPVDLAAQAQTVAEFFEVLSEDRNITITVSGAGEVLGEPGLIQRAITNLLSNAVRHGAPDSEVRVRIQGDSVGTSLVVENAGEPINQEHLSKLFDRFYRVDASRSRDAGGTGLGLAIVKAIMLLHQGSVRAENNSNGRIRFILVFPR
jgi:two-component system heavy metal sensor histidine kinase CusS